MIDNLNKNFDEFKFISDITLIFRNKRRQKMLHQELRILLLNNFS